MANIKTTDKEWERAREYFEAGLSLSEIVKKTGISKTRLCVVSKRDGWSKETGKEQLVSEAIRVETAKGTLNGTALMVHKELVNDRVKAIEFFSMCAAQNVNEAMLAPCLTQSDFKARSETISKGRETVIGKQVDTAIQINNNGVSSSVTDMDENDMIAEAKAIASRLVMQ